MQSTSAEAIKRRNRRAIGGRERLSGFDYRHGSNNGDAIIHQARVPRSFGTRWKKALIETSTPRPLALTDDESSAIMNAAQLLSPDRIASAFASCGEIGPGVIHRVIVATAEFFEPPDLSRGRDCSRWR